jgi:hypothetical protein
MIFSLEKYSRCSPYIRAYPVKGKATPEKVMQTHGTVLYSSPNI